MPSIPIQVRNRKSVENDFAAVDNLGFIQPANNFRLDVAQTMYLGQRDFTTATVSVVSAFTPHRLTNLNIAVRTSAQLYSDALLSAVASRFAEPYSDPAFTECLHHAALAHVSAAVSKTTSRTISRNSRAPRLRSASTRSSNRSISHACTISVTSSSSPLTRRGVHSPA